MSDSPSGLLKPLRILHTNMLRGWGGQSNRILMESLAVTRSGGGHEVALALPRGSALSHRARAARLRVIDSFAFRGPVRLLSFLRDVRALRRLLAAEPWDILHLHGSPDSWTAAFALRGLERRPAVIRTRHNTFPISRHPLNAWLYGRHVDGLVVISRAIERQCAQIPFLARKPMALIGDAPDLGPLSTVPPDARWQVREELATPLEAPVALCAGRLRLEKGQDFLIRAMPAVRKALPGVQLWLAGDGSHRRPYEKLARDLDLHETVRFLGFRSDVPALLAAADLVVVPSRSEGLGTVALEALAAGVPVVASEVGGLPDAIRPGETGELVPVGDTRALADAVVRLLRDPHRRAALGRRGRQLVADHFTEACVARKTLEFYSLVRDRVR